MVTHYLIVERKENWLVDKAANFSAFGLPDRYRTVAGRVCEGDLLFTYISGGVSALADIRECTRDGHQPLRHGGDYDTGFPIQISTRPQVVLEPARWVQIHRLVDRLSFLKGRTDWRQSFRQTIRVLPEEDATAIHAAIQTAKAAF
jgi:hypothetical protein